MANDTKICNAGSSECLFASGSGNEVIISMFGDCPDSKKYVNLEMTLTRDQTETLILTLQRRLQEDTL